MKPQINLGFYSHITNKWVSIKNEFLSIIEHVNVSLEDFDVDNFSIDFNFPQAFNLYEEFLNSPYLLEGNLIHISVGYSEIPSMETTLMYGVITATRVKESIEDVVLTISGTDLSIILKGKIIESSVLKKLSNALIVNKESRDNAPVLLVKQILDKRKTVLKELNDVMKKEYKNLPNFGLNYTEESIPDISPEELKYRRFVHVSNMSQSEQQTAKQSGAEWGIADKPAQAQFLEAVKQGSGYEIYTTYIDTISSLGVILGRVFWYDSKSQVCHFKRPQDITDRKTYVFKKTNLINLTPFERILDFEADYTSLDAFWTIQSNFVSVYKTSEGVKVEPVIVHVEGEPAEVDSDEVVLTNPKMPTILGAGSLMSQIESKHWENIKRTSPDTFEIVSEAKKTFYLKEFTVSATLAVQGNPAIRPHDVVWVLGVGKKFEGVWLVSNVSHSISFDKYLTQIQLVRNLIAVPRSAEGEFKEIVSNNVQKDTDNSQEEIAVVIDKVVEVPTFQEDAQNVSVQKRMIRKNVPTKKVGVFTDLRHITGSFLNK